jgi:nitrile hydratase
MDTAPRPSDPAPLPQRVQAVQGVLEDALGARGFAVHDDLGALDHAAAEEWVPANGARVVARAWVDPDFRRALLADGRAAVVGLGLPMPAHHRHLVVLENTPEVHNVICCTLCSCTAFTLIGLPPDWYKDLDYRARIVRQARQVLAEMGLTLSPEIRLRVWDTTADTRYLVLPMRPGGTDDWSEARLAGLVTRDGLIGAAQL